MQKKLFISLMIIRQCTPAHCKNFRKKFLFNIFTAYTPVHYCSNKIINFKHFLTMYERTLPQKNTCSIQLPVEHTEAVTGGAP